MEDAVRASAKGQKKPQRKVGQRYHTSARITSVVLVPHKYQAPIMKSQAKITAAISGHHGGKTHIGPYWLMQEIKRNGKGWDYIVCGPTYGTLRKAPIPKFLSLVQTMGWPRDYDHATGVGYRTADHEYHLPGGGVIYFVSADKPGSMQGVHAKGFWMDETVNTTYEVYETLLGRIAGFDGRGLITSTPYDMGWLYENVYKIWVADGRPKSSEAKEVFVQQWRSIDNPGFPVAEFERLRKRLPPWRFRMLYEGQFERPAGLVYDCLLEEHYIEPIDIPLDWERWQGVDWGFTDPMAGIWLARNPENDMVIAYDEFYQSGWMRHETHETKAERGAMSYPTQMMDEMIKKSLERNEQLRAAYCDPARPEYVEQYRDKVMEAMDTNHVYGADHAILPGIDRCYSMIQSGKFRIFNTLKHFRDEAEKYQYETDKATGEIILNEKKAAPRDKDNHLMDAFRYALAGSPDEPKGRFAMGRIDHEY